MKLFQGFGGFASSLSSAAADSFEYITTASPSAVSSITLSNCFSADYDHYMLEANLVSSANATDFLVQLRTGGSTAATGYERQNISIANNTVTAARISSTFIYLNTGSGTGGDGLSNFARLYIFNPFSTALTTFVNNRAVQVNDVFSMSMTQEHGFHDQATSYESLVISDSTGNMSGTADLYGWRV